MGLKIAGAKKGLLWHGSFFVHHSLALVNRELNLALLENEHFRRQFDLGIVPYEPDTFDPTAVARFAPLVERHGVVPKDVQLTVRHRWPPEFSAPDKGQFVLFQHWEFGSIPTAWVKGIERSAAETWVSTNWVKQCFVQGGVPEERVSVIPLGINPNVFHTGVKPYDFSENPLTRHIKPDTYTFLFVGGTIPRKGIDVLLDAYDRGFTARDNVTLIIKDFGTTSFYANQGMNTLVRALQAKPGGANIVYLTDEMTEAEIASLYAACDCLVHPYRGEGYGLPIAEAMACGKPTILTQYGSALDFATPANSYQIPSRIQHLSDKRVGDMETVSYPFWAEPDRPLLTELMRHVIANRDEASAKGQRAAEDMVGKHTWAHAAEAVTERVGHLIDNPVSLSSFALPMGLGNVGIGLQIGLAQPDGYEQRKQNALAEARLGKWEEARTALSACLEERPDDWDIINALGVVSFRCGDFESAVALFEKGISLSPRPRDFHHNMAFILLESGEFVKALEFALQALDFARDNPDIRRTVERVGEGVLQLARKVLRQYPDNQRLKAKQDPKYKELMARYHVAKEILNSKSGQTEVKAVVQTTFNKKRARLSLCMIVKNEERFLRGCLESCQDVVDEMIIVDTGSTDRTVEIAESFGAKVIHHEWKDDFSEARNISLAHATGDWALWLDADEEIAPESRSLIREVMESATPDVGAFMMMFRNWLTAPERREGSEMAIHHACRLFRRLPGVQFEGRIHEQNLRSLQALGFTYHKRDNMIIDHFGYAGEVMSARNKHERFIRMLQREVEECPDEGFRQFHLFNLGNAYFTANDVENAAHYLAIAAETADPAEEFTLSLFTELATSLHRLGRSEEGLYWCSRADTLGIQHPGIEFARGYCSMLMKDYAASEQAFYKAIELTQKGDLYSESGDAGVGTFKTWYGLALALTGQNRFAEARMWCEKALELQPNMHDARFLLAMTYFHEECFDKATPVLEETLRLYPSHSDAQRELLRIYTMTKNWASALPFIRQFAQENQVNYDAQSKWATCCESLGLYEEAREALESMRRLAPYAPEVHVSLGRVYAALGANAEAIDSYAEAIHIAPRYGNAYFNAGDLLYQMGFYAKAAETYIAGLEVEPDHASGFFTLGNCYFQTKDYAAAVACYNMALQQDPTLERVKNNLELAQELVVQMASVG